MPWKIMEGGKDCPFEVVKEGSGERVACHPTEEKAKAHLKALYANMPEGEHMMTRAEQTAEMDAVRGESLMNREVAVDDVDYHQRLVTVIAAPYEQPATVEWRGELWSEIFERGAFASVMNKPTRVRVNREHNRARPVGKVRRFWAENDDERGLIAEVKIAKTDLGDETLALAAEDMVGASVGYKALPQWARMDRRNMTRRVQKAYLDHLAFVQDPAYEGAEVLNVREDQLPSALRPRLVTPNLDQALTEIETVLRWADERLRNK